MIIPVILAGGVGSRLWPLSRADYPKQFLRLTGDESLLQTTYSRVETLGTKKNIVVCNNDHRFIVAEQLKQYLDSIEILLEPEAKSTAPAVALAAFRALKIEKDPILLVLPADHYVSNIEAFNEAVEKAYELAKRDHLVTLGITGDSVETGYGYIKKGQKTDHQSYIVDNFIEKPNKKTAQQYVDSQEYFWNSGMFVFRANRYLEALDKYAPEIFTACEKSIQTARSDLDFIRTGEAEFKKCPSNSIDYAVMEPVCSQVSSGFSVHVVPLNSGWSDIGSWSAIGDVQEKNEHGNRTTGDTIVRNSTNCLVHSEDRLVAVLGMNETVVIETKDAVLVTNRENVQKVGDIVNALKSEKRDEWKTHREVFRPWGRYDVIDTGEHYKIKRITVNPGAKLSLQKHRHRAEHWVVVSGTAMVTLEKKSFWVTENQSTFIPMGKIHTLENPKNIPLELVEVQTGEYLGEDDIVRFADDYGRV